MQFEQHQFNQIKQESDDSSTQQIMDNNRQQQQFQKESYFKLQQQEEVSVKQVNNNNVNNDNNNNVVQKKSKDAVKASNIKRNCWKCVGNLFRKYIQKSKFWDQADFRAYIDKCFMYDKVSKQDWKNIFSDCSLNGQKVQAVFKEFLNKNDDNGQPIYKAMLSKLRQSGQNLNREEKMKIYEEFILCELKNLFLEQKRSKQSNQEQCEEIIALQELKQKKQEYLQKFNMEFDNLIAMIHFENGTAPQQKLQQQQQPVVKKNYGSIDYGMMKNLMQNVQFVPGQHPQLPVLSEQQKLELQRRVLIEQQQRAFIEQQKALQQQELLKQYQQQQQQQLQQQQYLKLLQLQQMQQQQIQLQQQQQQQQFGNIKNVAPYQSLPIQEQILYQNALNYLKEGEQQKNKLIFAKSE